jgi:hypothetical protein
VEKKINSELQAAKIEERLRSERFKRKLSAQGGRAYDPEQSWLHNAEEANPPFDMIIARGSARSGAKIGAELLLKDEAPFARSSQGLVARKKEALIGVAKPLVFFADEIVIIDPNFRADEPRFCDSLKHLISVIESSGRAPKRLEIHTNRVRKPGETFNRSPHVSQWEVHVMPHLPKNWQLTVCYWEKLPNGGKPHARFLLTEMGGIYIDHGIDEGDGETLITLLEESVWELLFGLYDARALPSNFDREQHLIQVKG